MDPITDALNTYHELNAFLVDQLSEEPSPMEFMRYVAKNRPFKVLGAAHHWDAVEKWDASYLTRVMGKEKVKVAVTPHGNADAVVEVEDGRLLFVEPFERMIPFCDFLDDVREVVPLSIQGRLSRTVKYAQTQNDNLRDEYERLLVDVPNDIPFARIALGKRADAINMWIGDDRSLTALHKDNYENVYVQIRGMKHFVLLPPVEMPCVNERPLPHARYAFDEDEEEMVVDPEEDGEPRPVPLWDPDVPDKWKSPYSHLARPLRTTLMEGDMLYLPAMWYHKVAQTAGDEGFACSVNYWYDMDFDGGFWTANNFMRDVVTASRQTVKYPDLEMGETA